MSNVNAAARRYSEELTPSRPVRSRGTHEPQAGSPEDPPHVLLEARWAEQLNRWSEDGERGILLQTVPKVAALSNGSHAIVIRRFF